MIKRKYFIRFDMNVKGMTYGSKLRYIKKSKVLEKFKIGNMEFFIWYYKIGKVYQVVELKSGMMTVESKKSIRHAKRKFFKWMAKTDTTYEDLEKMSRKAISYYSEKLEQKWYGKKCIENGTYWKDLKQRKQSKLNYMPR